MSQENYDKKNRGDFLASAASWPWQDLSIAAVRQPDRAAFRYYPDAENGSDFKLNRLFGGSFLWGSSKFVIGDFGANSPLQL